MINRYIICFLLVPLASAVGGNWSHADESKVERAPSSVPKFKALENTSPPAQGVKTEDSTAPDKSHFHLFKPTPVDQMRGFDSDRPGVTYSPRTVDAGHFKVESGLFNYSQHKTVQVDEKKYVYNSIALGVGLNDFVEFQTAFDSFVQRTTSGDSAAGGDLGKVSGVGDTTVGMKFNILGNEEGAVAFAVIPSIKVPTNSGGVSNKKIEGGIGFPFGFALPSEWSLSIMPECDRIKNANDDNYHSEVFTGFVFGHRIIEKLGGFGQFSGRVSDEPNTQWIADSGFGFTYLLAANLQIDTDFRFGLTTAADDFKFSTGIVFRH